VNGQLSRYDPRNPIRFLQRSETSGLVVLALLVGAASGLGAVAFRWLINGAHTLFFDGLGGYLTFLGPFRVVLVPAVGGLIVGPMIYFLAREAKGHGVPEVMYAVALMNGRIRPRVAVIKSLASSICIGSGGSVGREGPIVQIGSALGSTLGQLLHLDPARVRLLVACGAAGGISATFNAPIAGVLFALEVILRQFRTSYFGVVVLASVTASVVGRMAFGNTPAFSVPKYSMVSAWELVLYFVLGILAAVLGIAFVRVLYAIEDLWDDWKKIPEWLKPVVGGLLIGLLGVFAPQLFGVGYPAMEAALRGETAVWLVALLAVLKILATSITIGSGGSGGVFAPSLFIGAMMGSAIGQLANAWFPGWTGHSGGYAMVGMAAVFAAAAHAPMTSILILFEMTNDYAIILPLMTAVVVSTILSQRLQRESIYTLKLLRRGIDVTLRRDLNLMDTILVEESMTRDPDTVSPEMPVSQLIHEFEETWHHGFPVVDKDGRLVGIVTLTDITRATLEPSENLTVGDVCTRNCISCHPDETLNEALKQFGARDVGRLPVVDRLDHGRLLGVLRRGDIVTAYSKAALQHADHLARIERTKQVQTPGAEFVEVDLPPGAEAVGKRIKQLDLPHDCLLISVRRGARTVIPHGDTLLEPNDRVLALCRPEDTEPLRAVARRPLAEEANARVS